MKYYKVLDKQQRSCNGGKGRWKPNKWKPEIKGQLIPCSVGYHLCRKKDLIDWLNEEIWIAKGRGKKIVCNDKVVFSQARILKKLDNWNERTARLFACDCAEHNLKYYEKEYPQDSRPRNAIEVARKYALGKATEKELDAARAAAWAAAQAAAWDAARDAAWAATWAVARVTERKWQTKKLFEYLNGKAK